MIIVYRSRTFQDEFSCHRQATAVNYVKANYICANVSKSKLFQFGYWHTQVNVRGINETAIHPQCQCMEILKDRYLDIDVRD